MTTVFPRLPPLPDAIDRSPLMRQGGLDIYEGLLDERTGQALLEEAMDAAKQGIPQDSSLPNPEVTRSPYS